MKKYVLIVMIFVVAAGFYAQAASDAECAAFLKIHKNATCTSETPQSLIDAVKQYGFSENVAEAKEYIRSITKNLRNSNAPPTCPGNIDRLNNTFVVCAANFLKAAESVYGKGSVTVVSAYRPPRDLGDGCGNNRAAGGATHSQHQRGLALDISPSGKATLPKLWRFAHDNPQFGVCFPYLRGDPPHMGMAGINSGEARRCANQGVTKICSGSPTFNPVDPDYNPHYAQSVNTGHENDLTASDDWDGAGLGGAGDSTFGSPYDGQYTGPDVPEDVEGNMGPGDVNLDDEEFDPQDYDENSETENSGEDDGYYNSDDYDEDWYGTGSETNGQSNDSVSTDAATINNSSVNSQQTAAEIAAQEQEIAAKIEKRGLIYNIISNPSLLTGDMAKKSWSALFGDKSEKETAQGEIYSHIAEKEALKREEREVVNVFPPAETSSELHYTPWYSIYSTRSEPIDNLHPVADLLYKDLPPQEEFSPWKNMWRTMKSIGNDIWNTS